ncbi:MAG: radical SAM protein, partial [Pirellulales bacterium]|nr:radical SAM protein [Pirellulales bacterium]
MAAETDLLPRETRQTTAGNYFVANYPPFSFWKPAYRGQALEVLQQEPRSRTPLGLYLHLPFCRKRCHFCYFRVYTGREAKRDRVTAYIDAVLKELKLYADKPLIAGRRPRYVYFGGGTPSFLSPQQLQRLIHGMKDVLPWNDAEEVTFECEPGTLDQRKLDVLRELG